MHHPTDRGLCYTSRGALARTRNSSVQTNGESRKSSCVCVGGGGGGGGGAGGGRMEGLLRYISQYLGVAIP